MASNGIYLSARDDLTLRFIGRPRSGHHKFRNILTVDDLRGRRNVVGVGLRCLATRSKREEVQLQIEAVVRESFEERTRGMDRWVNMETETAIVQDVDNRPERVMLVFEAVVLDEHVFDVLQAVRAVSEHFRLCPFDVELEEIDAPIEKRCEPFRGDAQPPSAFDESATQISVWPKLLRSVAGPERRLMTSDPDGRARAKVAFQHSKDAWVGFEDVQLTIRE